MTTKRPYRGGRPPATDAGDLALRGTDRAIVRRGVTSVLWNVLASMLQLAVLFVRATLLARWLPVEIFGIFAFAGAVVSLTSVGAAFGTGSAFLHRAPQTADEELAAAVHFTLRLILTLAWATVLIGAALVFASGGLRTAMVLLTISTGATLLAEVPGLVLVRRVHHQRLALLQILGAVASTLVALGLAWHGVELGALLGAEMATAAVTVIVLYLWRPVLRPRVALSPAVVRHFLSLGARNMCADALQIALERVDRLWIGHYLGKTPLGFYSRAHAFAGFARAALPGPVSAVAGGVFAELMGDHRRLSQAFFRTNALVVRGAFFLGGLVLVVAPEFIRLVLGPKWLPMHHVFTLAVAFAMIEPVRTLPSILFSVLGRPQVVIRVQLVQLPVLVLGLFALGLPFGAVGVAFALDATLVLGVALLLGQARAHVAFSPWRLFAPPALGLLVGLTLAGLTGAVTAGGGSDWRIAVVKALLFCSAYSGTLAILERRPLSELRAVLTEYGWTRPAPAPSGFGAPEP